MWPSEKFVPLLNIFFSLAAIGLQVNLIKHLFDYDVIKKLLI